MINEAKQDLENLQLDMAELEDLRVMKGDIQRQEKANAELIQSQAKRLEELETLYKEEQARCSICSAAIDSYNQARFGPITAHVDLYHMRVKVANTNVAIVSCV